MSEVKILYAAVGFFENHHTDYRIIADHSYLQANATALRELHLKILGNSKIREFEKMSFNDGPYTIHLLQSNKICYSCLTPSTGSANQRQPMGYETIRSFLEKLRAIHRELDDLVNLEEDVGNLLPLDLTQPLQELVGQYNSLNGQKIPKLQEELAQIRRILMEGLEKILNRGQELDELLKKTQSLENMAERDFQLSQRLPKSKRKKKKSTVFFILTGFASITLLVTGVTLMLIYFGVL